MKSMRYDTPIQNNLRSRIHEYVQHISKIYEKKQENKHIYND
jgi:hypothetical protein